MFLLLFSLLLQAKRCYQVAQRLPVHVAWAVGYAAYVLVLVLTLTGYAASVIQMLLMRSGDVEPNPGPSKFYPHPQPSGGFHVAALKPSKVPL